MYLTKAQQVILFYSFLMAQQFMTNSYDQAYPSLQTHSSIHYKPSPIEIKTFQVQCSQPCSISTAPIPIYPYVSSSDTNPQSMVNVVEPLVSSNTMSPTFKSDDMPTLSQFPGQFDFNIFVPNAEYDEAKRKGQTCVFETDQFGNHLLYTKQQPHYWRLNYSVSPAMLTENTFIRMVPVYGDPEKAQCILERCAKHKENLNNDNVWKNRSMLIVEKTCAHYFQDNISKRVCVLMPFEKHAEGQSYSSVNCQFVCYNSCFNQDSGGKKTLYLIITLETLDTKSSKFEVIGRQCLKFRSCACPNRDWRDKKIKFESELFPKVKEKRVKVEEKLTVFKSTPINMGGKDAIIRVLPSFPGIDEAVNALVSGYLFNRASVNGDSMEAVNDVFRQLKNVENCIIEQFTSNYEPNVSEKMSPASSVDSQISPIINTSTSYSDYSIFQDTYPTYTTRPAQPAIMPTYPLQTHYSINDFHSPYSNIKHQTDVQLNYDDLTSERSYRH